MNIKNLLLKGLTIFLTLFYFEIIFRISVFNSFFSINLIYIIFFNLSIALFLTAMLSIFNSRVNSKLWKIILFVIAFIISAQIVYYDTYSSIISLYSFGQAGDVMEYKETIVKMTLTNIVPLTFCFLPFILSFFIKKEAFKFKRTTKKGILILLLLAFFIHTISLGLLFLNKDGIYSHYNLYHNTNAPVLSAEKLGILTTMKLDVKRTIFEFEENLNIEVGNNPPKIVEPVYDANMIDYDFDSLIADETNEKIKTLHNYFKNSSPTYQNEYTGIFKDKNLIVILAEALDPIAIDKEITPTLYKLTHEGFVFNNYYTPLFPVSTSDGEYLQQVGLIPKQGVWSLKESKDNYLPFTLANMFKNEGYNTRAYHGHTGTYYSRDLSIPNLGYDEFKACKMGLDINCKSWPESDLEMVNATVDEYINDEKFITYYISISGHLNYTRTGNVMVRKNWDYVKDLPYSDLTKGYISAQKEFDLALESLIQKLEEQGILDDTVIAINPDHYPYGLKLENLNEVSPYYRDDNFEKHRSTMIIWNNQIDTTEVDTLCSNIDTIPTLANLFNLDYDSRMLMGKDIFSEHEPLVIFSNRSFISERGRYNSIEKSFEGEEVEEDYVNNINQEIYNRFEISKQILDLNYYNYLK